MNMRRRSRSLGIGAIAAVAMLFSSAAFAQETDRDSSRRSRDRAPAVAKIGEPAPNFRARDANDKLYRLSDYEGKIVVLQWINPGCPVCRRVNSTGLTRNMVKQLRAIDSEVVHLTVDSTQNIDVDKSVAYLKEHGVKSPLLIDTSGRLGRAYAAKTTPHMYIIDQKGILRYNGAIDDDPSGAKGAGATNYVVNAVQLMASGETVTPFETKAYGCAVKLAPASESRERGGERRRGGFGFGGADREELMKRFDTDGDGELNDEERQAMRETMRAEWEARMLEEFDADGDGELSEEERQKAREAMGRGRGGGRGGAGGRGGGAAGGDGGDGGDGG